MGRVVPGRWRDEGINLGRLKHCNAHRTTREAYDQEDTLTKYLLYLLSPASEITWQYKCIYIKSINHDKMQKNYYSTEHTVHQIL